MLPSPKQTVLHDLISLSHRLGDEARDYAIIGEGNTSARIAADTFWIKASGQSLRTIEAEGFVEVHLPSLLSMLDRENAADDEITRGLMDARVDQNSALRPSVESILHAALYGLTDAQLIGHTHPVAVNSVLCSQRAQEITNQLMPDVIVVCGAKSVFVPYTDPGLPLARLVFHLVDEFVRQNAQSPRVIYLQNHGMFALGQTARQVENITAMADKHARILAGTYALGGPNFLEESDVTRIHTRPDEEIRRRQFK